MTREETINNLKERLPEYVERITYPSKYKSQYVCPLCGSGTGPKGTGAFTLNKDTGYKTWKCFACGEGGDIFDLVGLVENLETYPDKLEKIASLFNVDIPKADYQGPKEGLKLSFLEMPTEKETAQHSQPAPKADPVDLTPFFLEAKKNLQELEDSQNYASLRGISKETQEKYWIGYIPNWKHPNASENAPKSPRLIVPTSNQGYLARDTRKIKDIPDYQVTFEKQKVGPHHLFNFNKAVKQQDKPIFVVEGEIDALSVIEAGGEAISLGGVANVPVFLEGIKKAKVAKKIVIALDNDEAGQEATQRLINGLSDLETPIPYSVDNISLGYKDPNEALVKDKNAFKKAVEQAIKSLSTAEKIEQEEYFKNRTANYVQQFIDGISQSVDTKAIPTGFNRLDTLLDGGLYEGLYVVGAISSLGKTTLVAQMMDNIASNEIDVLFFSLEMARSEIMAKSISRETIKSVLEHGGDKRNAKTTRGITAGSRYENYNAKELELIKQATETYAGYAEHIYIHEGLGNIGYEEVRRQVANHVKYTGRVPVVIIDYLQILAPYKENGTDKQNTDKSVLELKRISRDFKTPVIAISSFNRENYANKVSMTAFKESGAIEYSSDVLIGLQLKQERGDDVDTLKKKDPREIELYVLKNRNGRTGTKQNFNFYAMFNYFEETDTSEDEV